MPNDYMRREFDQRFASLEHRLFDDKEGYLPRIEIQTTKHNGRLTRVERYLLIVGTAAGVLLMVNGSEFIRFILAII